MTRLVQTGTRPETTYEFCAEITCNLCGTQAPRPDNYDSETWSHSGWEYNGVIIQRVTGDHFPECISKNTLTWDICPDCFSTVVEPLLGEPHEERYDW